jgi:hypothetical protein
MQQSKLRQTCGEYKRWYIKCFLNENDIDRAAKPTFVAAFEAVFYTARSSEDASGLGATNKIFLIAIWGLSCAFVQLNSS